MIRIRGKSKSPDVGLGKQLKIAKKTEQKNLDYGKFLVTEIQHSLSPSGDYLNVFSGISAEARSYQSETIRFPVANPQSAYVKDTPDNDPEKIGRVKVQMLWQDANQTTDWIQVGKLWTGENTRGTTFSPQLNDEVLIGFKYGNPDLPYVMGSLFNSKNASRTNFADENFMNMGNGSTLYFKDDIDNLELGFSDSRMNEIKIDTKANRTHLNAKSMLMFQSGGTMPSIVLKAQVIRMLATQLVKIGSGTMGFNADISNNVNLFVNDKYILNARKIDQKSIMQTP